MYRGIASTGTRSRFIFTILKKHQMNYRSISTTRIKKITSSGYVFNESSTNIKKILMYPIDFATQVICDNKLNLYCQAVENDHEIAKKLFLKLNTCIRKHLAYYLCFHYHVIKNSCIVKNTIEASDDFSNLLVEEIIFKFNKWPDTLNGNKIMYSLLNKLSPSTKDKFFRHMILNKENVPLSVLCIGSRSYCDISSYYNYIISSHVLTISEQILKITDRTMGEHKHEIFKLNWCGLLSSDIIIKQWEHCFLRNIESYGLFNDNMIRLLICSGSQTIRDKLMNQIIKIKNAYMYEECMILLKLICENSDDNSRIILNDYFLEHSSNMTHNNGYLIGTEWDLRFIRNLEMNLSHVSIKVKNKEIVEVLQGLRDGVHERLNYDIS